MNELVQKLFEAELSEGDWELLESQAASSPDLAEEIASLARERYVSFGLPVPGGEEGGPGRGLWLGALTLVGAMFWAAWPFQKPELPLAAPALGHQGANFHLERP
jgi:hypothetical protein